MSYAFRCEACNGRCHWRVTRIGDVVTSWACSDHLAYVCWIMQKDRALEGVWVETELSVVREFSDSTIPGERGDSRPLSEREYAPFDPVFDSQGRLKEYSEEVQDKYSGSQCEDS